MVKDKSQENLILEHQENLILEHQENLILEYYHEIGYVWVDPTKQICLEDYIETNTLNNAIKVLNQILLLSIVLLVPINAFAATNMRTFQDLKNDSEAEQIRQSAKDLKEFYNKIQIVIKESIQEEVNKNPGVKIMNIYPGPKSGPQLIPFWQLERQKNLKIAAKQTQELIKLTKENNLQIERLVSIVSALRGGFLGAVLLVGSQKIGQKIGQIWQVRSKKIVDTGLKKDESKKELEEKNFIYNFGQWAYLPLFLALALFSTSSRERVPEGVKSLIPFERKKKSWAKIIWEASTNFNSPTSYIIICMSLVVVAIIIYLIYPNSTVGAMLSKMIDTMLASFTIIPQDGANKAFEGGGRNIDSVIEENLDVSRAVKNSFNPIKRENKNKTIEQIAYITSKSDQSFEKILSKMSESDDSTDGITGSKTK